MVIIPLLLQGAYRHAFAAYCLVFSAASVARLDRENSVPTCIYLCNLFRYTQLTVLQLP